MRRLLPEGTVGRLALVFLFAFTLRAGVALTLVDPEAPVGDAQYDRYAQSIRDGKGYRARIHTHKPETKWAKGLDELLSFKPPLYPVFLAATYLVFGRDFVAVAIAQGALGALTCLVVFFVGREIFGQKEGFLSALLFAVYPYHVFQGITISDSVLFTLLVALGVLFLFRLVRSRSVWDIAFAGVLLGLAALCRPNIVSFYPFAALWLLLRFSGRKAEAIRAVFLVFFFAILVFVPWSLRNYSVHGGFVLFGTNGGYTFWQANNPLTEKYLKMRNDTDRLSAETDWGSKGLSSLSERERDKWFYTEGRRFIRENPDAFMRLAALKFKSMWSWTIYPVELNRTKGLVYTTTYVPVLFTALLGIAMSLGRWKDTSLLLMLFLSFTVTYMVFYGKTVYRSPLDPFLMVFSAYALLKIYSMATKGRQREDKELN